ncbi:hypothetical protein CDL12_11341 [Handroanthus impetiginosus]|uniref:DC1 domain-containing protein n=1 Tax=Handroanthus impetiginosus TaxID=429701 RepID=A0A2G9HER2_9LAMI|nr:hypothetical protein CDL12_11341 [Handroanthus impetiginosus]
MDEEFEHFCHEHPLILASKWQIWGGGGDWDLAYVCLFCEFWMHKSCALLPTTFQSVSHHQHPLSLSYFLPHFYLIFRFNCDICHHHIYLMYWVYYCARCRFLAHAKRGTQQTNSIAGTSKSNTEQEDGSLIQLPVKNVPMDLIVPFLIRQKMYYSCDKCKFFLHLSCYNIPSELEHDHVEGSHKLSLSVKGALSWSNCYFWYAYVSENYDFNLHHACAMLPRIVRHTWDKHPLPLAYPPYSHHSGDIYCEICEQEIHPKRWTYHCRECDQFFHPDCLSRCGYYRNIKFGCQLVLENRHRQRTVPPDLEVVKDESAWQLSITKKNQLNRKQAKDKLCAGKRAETVHGKFPMKRKEIVQTDPNWFGL